MLEHLLLIDLRFYILMYTKSLAMGRLCVIQLNLKILQFCMLIQA